MKESITQMQGVFTNLIIQQNATQVQSMDAEVRDLEMKVGYFLANQSKNRQKGWAGTRKCKEKSF